MLMDNIRWLGHSSFLIKSEIDDTTILIDPFKTNADIIADFILITHTHYDHFSENDILKHSNRYTTIFAPTSAKPKLKEIGFIGNIIIVDSNNRYQHENLIIDTIPAYNLYKGFHPKSNNWVGYVIELDRRKYYHAGDTDFVPEMKNNEFLQNLDVAMLPVGGDFTMDAKEAAKLANEIKPKIAIPMHWGTIVGKLSDAEEFKKLFNGTTKILDKE